MINENYGLNPEEPLYKGYVLDLMNAIGKKLNFSFEFILSTDKLNGGHNPITDTWTGIIGDIINEVIQCHLIL